MFNDGWMDSNIMSLGHGGWHGFLGFHGIVSFIGIVIIVFAVAALVRDWRSAHRDRPAVRHDLRDRPS